MSSVAEQLRQGREAKRLTIHQIADAIKIRSDHVIALEEGNYDVFAAPVYIRGFVRSYSRVLMLDTEQIMRQLDEELARSDKHREPPPLAPHSRGLLDAVMYQLSKVRWQIMAPVVGVVILLLLGMWAVRAWKSHQTRDPLAKLGQGIYQPAKTSDTLPLPAPRH